MDLKQKEEELALIGDIKETYSRLNKMKSDIRNIECRKNENHTEKPKEIEKRPICPSEPSVPKKPEIPSTPYFKSDVHAKDYWDFRFLIIGVVFAGAGIGLMFSHYLLSGSITLTIGVVLPFFIWGFCVLLAKTKERMQFKKECSKKTLEYRTAYLVYQQKLKGYDDLKRRYVNDYKIYKKKYDEWEVKYENYYSELKKCEEIDKTLDAEFEERKKAEITSYKEKNKFDQIEAEFKKMTYGVIGEKYFWFLDQIESYMMDGRADSIKEAIAVLEDDKHKQDLIDAQYEAAEDKKKTYHVIVFHYKCGSFGHVSNEKDSTRVHVEANSEAEAINAAMNMVPHSISAEIL